MTVQQVYEQTTKPLSKGDKIEIARLTIAGIILDDRTP
jgi:hypothetical protein